MDMVWLEVGNPDTTGNIYKERVLAGRFVLLSTTFFYSFYYVMFIVSTAKTLNKSNKISL